MSDFSNKENPAYGTYILFCHFSHTRLFVTPWTVAYQAPPSMGFPKQEY